MFPILNPPPPSLPIPSFWVVPVHQPQASSIVHRTWTGNMKRVASPRTQFLFSPKQGTMGFPGGFSSKESACRVGDAGDEGLIPGSGRSPVGDNGNPLQYSCLENPIDRGDWQSAVHGVPKSQTRLSDSTHTQAGNLLTLNLLQWLQRHLQ